MLFLSGVRHAALYLPTFLAHPGVKVLGICEEEAAPDGYKRIRKVPPGGSECRSWATFRKLSPGMRLTWW